MEALSERKGNGVCTVCATRVPKYGKAVDNAKESDGIGCLD